MGGSIFNHTQNVHVLVPILFTMIFFSLAAYISNQCKSFGKVQVLAVFSEEKFFFSAACFASIGPRGCMLHSKLQRKAGMGWWGCLGGITFPQGQKWCSRTILCSVHINRITVLHKSNSASQEHSRVQPNSSHSSAWSEFHLLSGGPNVCSEPWMHRQGCLTGLLPWFPGARFKLPKEMKSNSKRSLCISFEGTLKDKSEWT